MNFVTSAVRRSRAQIYKLVSHLATPPPKADIFISIATKPNDSSINDESHFGVPLIEDKMPEQNPVPLAIEERHQKAVELIVFLKKEIESLGNIVHEKSMSEEHKKLLEENKFLKKEVELWRAKVVALEEKQGIKQYPISSKLLANKREQPVGPFDVVDSSSSNAEGPNYQLSEKTNSKEKVEKKSAAPKKKEKTKATESAAKDDIKDIHVGRLDLRVGRIISVDKHPDADTLYVEQIDVGEERLRTVVSGLVKHIPIEQMQNRLVVALCNLKPAKMRGVLSEAMVMCASSPDKVEILNPPVNSTPGDLVTSDDFPGKPDAVFNPKKKIFEQVAPDLKTNDECVATYKLSVLKVGDKGVVKADTLTGVQIK